MEAPAILYEDDDMVAIDKPSGLVVHFDGRTQESSVCDWFVEHYPEAQEVGEPLSLQNGDVIQRPGVVHRLDRETSGVLVLAKTQEAHAHLKAQFHDRLAQKEYRALVYGHLKQESGTIDLPIGRSKKDPRLRSAMRGASGKLRDALTEYQVITRINLESERCPTAFTSQGGESIDVTHVAAFPKTGRTHQLRAHFKALHHPIVCDALYAPARAQRAGGPKMKCPSSIGRLALHAYALDITLLNGQRNRIQTQLPAFFT